MCWLAGPDGTESAYPQDKLTGSFTTSTTSLYIPLSNFDDVFPFILSNLIGDELDALIHPLFGCNFADHEKWSLHLGDKYVPNNMYGISSSGDYPYSTPSSLDPLGNGTGYPNLDPSYWEDVNSASNYAVFILFNEESEASTQAWNTFKDEFDAEFENIGYYVTFEGDYLNSYKTNSNCPFLAALSWYQVDSWSFSHTVMSWIMTGGPSYNFEGEIDMEDGISVVVAPFFSNQGYMSWHNSVYYQSMFFGYKQWPFNMYPLYEATSSAKPKTSTVTSIATAVERIHTEPLFDMKKLTKKKEKDVDASKVDSSRTSDYYITLFSAPNNQWQQDALEDILSSFSREFRTKRGKCEGVEMDDLPSFSNNKICIGNESSTPYYDSNEVYTTSYASIYVPNDSITTVLPFIMSQTSPYGTFGYEVDVEITPLPSSETASTNTFKKGIVWRKNLDAIDP